MQIDFLDKMRFVLAIMVVGDLVASPFIITGLVLLGFEVSAIAVVTAQFAVVATQAGNILKDYFDDKQAPPEPPSA